MKTYTSASLTGRWFFNGVRDRNLNIHSEYPAESHTAGFIIASTVSLQLLALCFGTGNSRKNCYYIHHQNN